MAALSFLDHIWSQANQRGLRAVSNFGAVIERFAAGVLPLLGFTSFAKQTDRGLSVVTASRTEFIQDGLLAGPTIAGANGLKVGMTLS